MKRKIALSIITFLLIFVATLWLSLPYENIAVKVINEIEKIAKIDLRYDQLTSGPLSTQVNDLEVRDIPLGKLTLHHGPLSLVFGKVGYELVGTINAEGKLSADEVTLAGDINSAIINSLTDQIKLTGNLKTDIKANPKDGSAEVVANADKAGIKTPMGMMDFENVTIEADSNGRKINIKKLTSEDAMALNLKGTIAINKKAPERSSVNIKGTFNLAGQKKEITLIGRADRLTPSIR